MSMLGRDAFGMKLHAVHGKGVVQKAHHKLIPGLGIDLEIGRHGCPINHKRVIASRLQRAVDTAKDSRADMLDFGNLAVNRGCPHDLAAESLSDGLVTKTDTEYRRDRGRLFDQFEADAGFVGRAWSRRKHN